MFEAMKQAFLLPDVDPAGYSPLTLAYIGDCVYEMMIRSRLVFAGNAPVNRLNRKASGLAKAGTQAAIIESLSDLLTEEEAAVYKRGRNAHPHTRAKNATVGDYRKATGFEALIGYLYLGQRFDRLTELVKQGLDRVKERA